MKGEDFGVKSYVKDLTVYEARTLFKHRSQMTQHVKMNYKNNSEYAKQLWKCGKCLKIDSENHLLWCDSYAHLRESKDLNNDRDLCKYLHKILLLRTKEDMENKYIVHAVP